MSEKCLYCEAPIEQTEGKRERKFCTPSHCTMYHLREKNKGKPKGQRGRPAGSKNKSKAIDFKEPGILNTDGSKEKIQFKKATPESFDVEQLENITYDEPKQWMEPKKKEDISEVKIQDLTKPKTFNITEKKSASNYSINAKTKKAMPDGLSKSDKLRWLRENP